MNVLYDFDDGKYMANFLFGDTLCKVVMVKGDPGEPTDAQVKSAVYEYLEEHPNTFNPEGEYEDLIAGNANQITSNIYTEDTTPYIFRAVSDSSVDVGNREVIEQITGGTVAWNQLVSSSATSVTITSGHKYVLYSGSAWSIGASTGSAITVSGSEGAKLFDLTQMFGTAIADYEYNQGSANCIAWFRGLFPNATATAYNAGELLSVKTSARETVGKNLLPSYINNGSRNGATWVVNNDKSIVVNGTATALTDIPVIDISKNFILPVGDYIFSGGASNGGNTNLYIAIRKKSAGSDRYIIINNDTPAPFSITEEDENLSVAIRLNANKTYSDMVWKPMIRFSSATDSAYEPYQKHTYPLSNIELRGIPKLVNNKLQYDGDIYKADGSVTRRYGIRAYQSGDATGETMITDGTNTVYALSTTTTETTTPYTETQICSPYGTEEFIDSRDVQIPVGHKTKYPTDQVKKLDGLPSDFSTLIAPTESGTASRNYSVGSFLIMNNQLYKVTSAIASGAAITVGTNVTATTLAEQIIALLNR